ncbi:MAG: heliorhodopsin HeR [Chloroflexota bacterium]
MESTIDQRREALQGIEYETETAQQAEESTFRNLRIFNGVMSVIHFIQAVLMVVLSNDFTVSPTTQFLEFDPEAPVGERIMQTIDPAFDVQLGPAIALFLFISATAHFLIAGPFFRQYVDQLRQEVNFYRWYEYSVSASIMIVAIAMLSGVTDIPFIITLFALNAAMIFFGHDMESMNRFTPDTHWTPFIFGCIVGIVPWIAIGMYFFGSLNNAEATIPDFVYAIFASIFVFFNIFALNQFLQYKQIGPWKRYINGEYVYIILSLVAKSALAWQVFSGTLQGTGA